MCLVGPDLGWKGGHHHVSRRQCHGGCNGHAILDECDVHRPIGAPFLAEFARAVERIHDPDPPRAETLLAVESLFREDRVARTLLREQLHEQHMCRPVTFVAKLLGLAQCHQCPTRGHGREAGELVV